MAGDEGQFVPSWIYFNTIIIIIIKIIIIKYWGKTFRWKITPLVLNWVSRCPTPPFGLTFPPKVRVGSRPLILGGNHIKSQYLETVIVERLVSLKNSLLFKSLNEQEGSSLHQWLRPNRPSIVKTRVSSLPGRQHPYNQVIWVWRQNSYPQVHRWRRRTWQEGKKVFVLSHEKRTAPMAGHRLRKEGECWEGWYFQPARKMGEENGEGGGAHLRPAPNFFQGEVFRRHLAWNFWGNRREPTTYCRLRWRRNKQEKPSAFFYFASFYYLPARVLKSISPGKETPGRYVIVQINKGPTFLNLKEVKAFGREAVEEPQKPEETKNPPGGLGFALTTALNEMGGQGK